MARKDANDYRLIDDKPSLEDAIAELKEMIERDIVLAVDCEGVSLSRKGALTVITVATEEKVFIVDVLKLGRSVFSAGLAEILEDKSHEKLMFDCRQDSDALWHQFHVRLTGVLDLQLLEVVYRREISTPKRQPPTQKYYRRSQRTDEVERINGFRRCLELYVQDQDLLKVKEDGKKILKRDEEVWIKRPLAEELIQYCIVDTKAMFKLYDKMKDVFKGQQERLRLASERYADMYRSRFVRYFDDYESNAFLPLDIIPDKGTLNFPPANTSCTCCHRMFPLEEFSKTQLRNREQKCRVCKEVKRLDDVETNRQANRARYYNDNYSSDDYVYYGSDDEYFCW